MHQVKPLRIGNGDFFAFSLLSQQSFKLIDGKAAIANIQQSFCYYPNHSFDKPISRNADSQPVFPLIGKYLHRFHPADIAVVPTRSLTESRKIVIVRYHIGSALHFVKIQMLFVIQGAYTA